MRSPLRHTRRLARASGEQGFAIVGVVMLVLALTILGLSLFSLSSYESQFINGSLDGQQAFDAATRGIERAKFQVLNSGRLEESNWGMPRDGVDSVRAWQVIAGTTYTTGTVNGGAPVFVRAYGHVDDALASVEGQYQPKSSSDYYRWLFATSGQIVVSTGLPGPLSRNRTVSMNGWVWQTTGPWSWAPNASVTWTNPPDSLRQGGGVPTPPLAPYLAAHPTAAMTVVARVPPTGSNPVYVLDAAGPDPRYFTSDYHPGIPDFSLLEAAGSPTVQVRGAAVWVVPFGIGFLSKLKVEPYAGGSANDCLVIVAGKSAGSSYFPGLGVGIWLDNGIESTIPVILVTDFRCEINSSSPINLVPYLSVYAQDVKLQGPLVSSGDLLALRHPRNSPNDAPNGLIDWLVQKGALPNGSTSRPELSMIPGTWKLTSN